MIPFPSGAKVAGAAISGLSRTYEIASVTAELPGRAVQIVADVEVLVARVGILVGRMERLATDAARVCADAAASIERVDALTAAAAAAITRVDAVNDDAGAAIGRVNALNDAAAGAVHEAAATVAEAARLTGTAGVLLDTYEPMARKAAPLAEKFVDSISPAEVDAAIKLVDDLPRLTEHLRSDVLPILATLDRVGPDIHELLEVTYDVRRAILGIPGFGFFKKRGEDILEDEETEAHDRDGSAP